MAVRSTRDQAELEQKLKEQDDELNQFLPLAGLAEPPRWDVHTKAKEVGLESIYRTAYWHLSRYIHPGYDMSRPEEFDTIPEGSDFIALLSPIDTAVQLHRVVADCGGCEAEEQYAELFERIAQATILKEED